MKFLKNITIFCLSFLISVSIPARIYASEKDAACAKSSILMCMDTGDIIKEENAYEHLSPASVTKIMSILLIVEAIDDGTINRNDMVSAGENAVSKGGSQIWLEVGEKMSVDDLLKAVIIASANDACTLLGEYVAGSESCFVEMMNSRAQELGLENTHFENCTGLDDEITNHYSCAYDLAVIACEVMKHSIVKDYSTVWLDSLRDGKTELNNTNKLINKYDGITGLKTGTTSNAGFCLCATAERDGMSLVSVVLGAETSEDRFNLSTQLLDYGFANYKLQKLDIDKTKLKKIKVKNGVVKSLTPKYDGNKKVLLAKNSNELNFEYKIKEELDAPVRAGDIIGEIIVSNDSAPIASIPLKSDRDIDKVTFKYIFIKMLTNI